MTRAASIFLLLAAGCAAPKYKISFESEPAGARVYYSIGPNEQALKEEYIGQTPCTWELEGNGDRTFKMNAGIFVYSTFVPPVVVFRADPAEATPGLYSQREVYHGANIVRGNDRIPEKLFFDLRKSPTVPTNVPPASRK